MLGIGAAVVVVVVGVRLLWLLPAAWLAKRMHKRRDFDEDIPLSWRETVIMWWSGMRGVASVALALAIPYEIDGGGDFPARDEILFIAFAVVLSGLVVQGLSLPTLVKKLRVRADSEAEEKLEHELALRVIKASKRRLKEILEVEELPEEVSEQLARRAYDMAPASRRTSWTTTGASTSRSASPV